MSAASIRTPDDNDDPHLDIEVNDAISWDADPMLIAERDEEDMIELFGVNLAGQYVQ